MHSCLAYDVFMGVVTHIDDHRKKNDQVFVPDHNNDVFDDAFLRLGKFTDSLPESKRDDYEMELVRLAALVGRLRGRMDRLM